jgi:hypothetical protein
MKNSLFSSGEKVEGYQVEVLNENEVRAAAGILFLFAIISFMNSWLVGEFLYTKIFVVAFLIEFFIRVLINPKYAPTLILAKFITRGQKPFYTGAIQKKWAWSIGLVLAVMMFYLIVLNDIKGPINLFTCLLCLTLLFFEAAFGICLGCKIHKFFNKNSLQDCSSGKCEVSKTENIQKVNLVQIAIFLLFLLSIYFISQSLSQKEIIKIEQTSIIETKKEDCQPPQWAIDMGHGEKWKLHHGCK